MLFKYSKKNLQWSLIDHLLVVYKNFLKFFNIFGISAYSDLRWAQYPKLRHYALIAYGYKYLRGSKLNRICISVCIANLSCTCILDECYCTSVLSKG